MDALRRSGPATALPPHAVPPGCIIYSLQTLAPRRFMIYGSSDRPNFKPVPRVPCALSLWIRTKTPALPTCRVRIELHGSARESGGFSSPSSRRMHGNRPISASPSPPDWKDGAYDLRVTATPAGSTQTVVRPIQLAHRLEGHADQRPPCLSARRHHSLPRPDPAQPGFEAMRRCKSLLFLPLPSRERQHRFQAKEVTSQFGICAGDCPLASELLEGAYTVQCRAGEKTSSLAVEVKKYVLPKFKVEVAADKPLYLPGQRVAGKVQAAYFFGKPVADAEVVLKLRSTLLKQDLDLSLKLSLHRCHGRRVCAARFLHCYLGHERPGKRRQRRCAWTSSPPSPTARVKSKSARCQSLITPRPSAGLGHSRSER